MVFADADGELFVERMDLQVGEREGSHGGAVGVVLVVLGEHAGVASRDLSTDEESFGRILVALSEAVEVAFVPGCLLFEKNFDDVELLLGGSMEWSRLRWQKRGHEECKAEGDGV